jgi:hypothetical protein
LRRERRSGGKSDALDAIRAARTGLGQLRDLQARKLVALGCPLETASRILL